MKHFALTVILILASTSLFAQTVSNVVVSQEGSNFVVLYDIDKSSSEIRLRVSPDGGSTFYQLMQISGDVENVQPGRHRIVWDALAESECLYSDNLMFKVVPTIGSGVDDEEEAIPFVLVKEKPKFRGGDADKFTKWVINNLVYPEIAKKNGIEGRVSLQFTIDTDGTVRDVVVLRGVNALLDREAVRIVSSSLKWTPGRIGDRPVKVTYTMPIIFYLKNNWEKRARVTPVPETI